MRLVLLIAAFISLNSGIVHADSFTSYPTKVQLDNARDLQRFTFVHTRDDGVTLDITKEVKVVLEPANLAELSPEGVWIPKADGEGMITATYKDKTIQVPLKVQNAAINPPMSFSNDIEAVLMRSGCNTGKCHGSARGKNGFRLSLFSYDHPHDYIALTRESRGRRLNTATPANSLILKKPLNEVPHEGGVSLEKDSLMYKMLHRWVEEGAGKDPAGLPTVTGIEILPKELVMAGAGTTQQFVIMAKYSDGTDRDVTDLSVLSSVDPSIISIDGKGMATSGNRGEAYVMARFSTFAVVSNIISIPVEAKPMEQPAPPVNYIDEFMYEKYKKLRITQSPKCSDEVFIRRVFIDALGVLPSVEETRAFLADTAPDKRAKLIDSLLVRPEMSNLWAMKWAETLRVNSTNGTISPKGMHRYNDWLRLAIQENKPMDKLVRELLAAEGGNFTSPASNFYLVEKVPNLVAENVALIFMGIQLQCAQCHNHPFDRWTMDDYYSFSAFFAQVGRKASSDPRETIVFNSGGGEVRNLRDNQVMKPKFLGGEVPDLAGRDRRVVLAEWLTSKENPWFAENLANKVWEHFLGRGIVEPIDDVRVTNPPSNPQLMAMLGEKLGSYDFDMRQLIRDICNSNTYQAQTKPTESAQSDTANFAYAQIRRLPSEVLLDAISQVTDTKVKFAGLPLGSRAVDIAGGGGGNYFLGVFGRPSRISASSLERRNEPTLAQVLHLVNGDTYTKAIGNAQNRMNKQLAAGTTDDIIIEDLYLAAYSRKPTAVESEKLAKYIAESPDRKMALEDIYWSVLNSKEFVFTH